MLFNSRHRRPSALPLRDPRVTAAACEALEPRNYRSATWSVADFDNNGQVDLRIRGSSSKEHVVITDDPATNTTTLWLDQDNNNVQNSKDVVKVFDNSFDTVDVDLGSGDDNLEYYAISAFDFSHRSLLLDVAAGNDKFTFDASGENNGVFNSSIVCDFDLDTGNDTASVKMGAVDNGLWRLNLDGGTGNDTISMLVGADVVASSVDIDVSLGTGKNTLDFVSTSESISSGSNFFLDIQGGGSGSEYDQVTTSFAGNVADARLFVTANLQGGNDSFVNSVVLQTFDIGDRGLVRFVANGGDGNDTVAVVKSGPLEPFDIDPAGLLEIKLAGGNGNDTVKLDLGGTDADHQRAIFLTGKMIVNLDGGAGSDIVSSALSFSYDPSSFGDLNMSMFGGAGNDTMLFDLLDFFPLEPEEEEEEEEPDPDAEPIIPPQTGFTYGPAGYVTIDAGAGTDKTTLSGTVLAQVRVRNSETLTVIPYTNIFF